jgi:hypothetical protein
VRRALDVAVSAVSAPEKNAEMRSRATIATAAMLRSKFIFF